MVQELRLAAVSGPDAMVVDLELKKNEDLLGRRRVVGRAEPKMDEGCDG